MKFVNLKDRLDEFDAMVMQHPQGGFAQSTQQLEVLRRREIDTEVVGIVDDNDVVIGGGEATYQQTRFGKGINFDRGPLLDFNDQEQLSTFINGLKQFAKDRHLMYVKMSPNLVYQKYDNDGNGMSQPDQAMINTISSYGLKHLPFKHGLVNSALEGKLKDEVSWQYVKEFGDSGYDEVKKTFSKNISYYLKKNKQFGVKLRQLPYEELNKFYNLTYETGERLGFGTKTLDYYQASYDSYGDRVMFLVAELTFSDYIAEEQDKIAELDKKLVKIQGKIEKYPNNPKFERQYNEFNDQKKSHMKRVDRASKLASEADDDTVIIAGGMFIKMPQEMLYLYSGTYEKYMEFYGPYQIQDAVIQDAIASGIKRYNMFGIDGSFDGSDGVFEFKKDFNGYAEQMIGTFEMPIQGMKLKLYHALKKLRG